MRYQIALVTLLFSLSVNAETANWNYVRTPRGSDLEIKITRSFKADAPLIIVAPGQSCNSKGLLFETIEQDAIKREINIVRFEWSYCSPSSTNRNPSDDLSSEVNDMDFAINYSKELLQKTNRDLFVLGKSLGSMITYLVFKNHPDLKSVTLLTPVCSYATDEQGKPLPSPKEATNENYPDLLLETRPILMISGNSDPLCDHTILKSFKEKSQDNLDVIYTKGDHGYRVFNSDGSVNQNESQDNLVNVSSDMLNWFAAH
ncbi:MAG: hypothetical protein H7281_14240 [Bacteriovorax sp.]|nr:hypothetical protein [Bacteriovorax sp.]